MTQVGAQVKKPSAVIGGRRLPLITQNDHGFVHGMPVYFDKGVNYWRKASADVTAEQYDTFAFCVVSDFVSINSFKVETVADITPADWTLITQSGVLLENGDALFLSQSEQGRYTNVQPTTGFEQQLGVYENGKLHFHPQNPFDLDALDTSFARVVETADYKLTSNVLAGNLICISVILKENTTGPKTIPIDLIPSGMFEQFCLLRYEQSIESNNYDIVVSGSLDGPVLNFNKLMSENNVERFGVLGVGSPIGTHMILDNSSYYYTQNIYSAYGSYPAYFGSLLLPQVKLVPMTMTVVYDRKCMSQIGMNFIGTIHKIKS